MRLRVVPGFISPPPGFGGLGYTPTARILNKSNKWISWYF